MLVVKGDGEVQLTRRDFQDSVLEMALNPHFLLYFWLGTWLLSGNCEVM